MQYTKETALSLFKGRLDRMKTDTSRDEMWKARIDDAIAYLTRIGVKIMDEEPDGVIDGADDLMLIVDLAVWRHQNRDKGEAEPKWLRRRIGERWLAKEKAAVSGA